MSHSPESLPRYRSGDNVPVEDLNRRSELAERANAVNVVDGKGLGFQKTPTGLILDDRNRRPILATLSGSGSPYSWVQAVEDSAGDFDAGGKTGTTNAYEVNGVSGLSGQVARLYPDPFGDWRFQWTTGVGDGCSLIVEVHDCSDVAVASATVEVDGPSAYSGSGSTTGGGMKSFSVTESGTYTGTVSKTGYGDAEFEVEVTCPGSNLVSVLLPQEGGACCVHCSTVPATLYANAIFPSQMPDATFTELTFSEDLPPGYPTLAGWGTAPSWYAFIETNDPIYLGVYVAFRCASLDYVIGIFGTTGASGGAPDRFDPANPGNSCGPPFDLSTRTFGPGLFDYVRDTP